MAFGKGVLHIMLLNTFMFKFYENSALQAILFKGMNEIVPTFCTFSVHVERFFVDVHKKKAILWAINEYLFIRPTHVVLFE
jgi:hypothetical protein